MHTLFQISANMGNLKTFIKGMANLWQSGDSLLLLGETAAYIDWVTAYISEINTDEESANVVENIAHIYILSDDVSALNDSAKTAIDFSKAIVLTDETWVELTHAVDRVITLK